MKRKLPRPVDLGPKLQDALERRGLLLPTIRGVSTHNTKLRQIARVKQKLAGIGKTGLRDLYWGEQA